MRSSQILQISTSYFRKENQEIIQIQRRLKGFLDGVSGKEPACQCRRHKRCGFDPWVRKNPWRREWHPTSVFLPGESHGLRILVGHSPWGCKESNRTEGLSTHTYQGSLKMICFTLWSLQVRKLLPQNRMRSPNIRSQISQVLDNTKWKSLPTELVFLSVILQFSLCGLSSFCSYLCFLTSHYSPWSYSLL